METKGRVCQM
jgi:hypothetical protein